MPTALINGSSDLVRMELDSIKVMSERQMLSPCGYLPVQLLHLMHSAIVTPSSTVITALPS